MFAFFSPCTPLGSQCYRIHTLCQALRDEQLFGFHCAEGDDGTQAGEFYTYVEFTNVWKPVCWYSWQGLLLFLSDREGDVACVKFSVTEVSGSSHWRGAAVRLELPAACSSSMSCWGVRQRREPLRIRWVVFAMDLACTSEFCPLLVWPFALASEGDLEKAASVPQDSYLPVSCPCPLEFPSSPFSYFLSLESAFVLSHSFLRSPRVKAICGAIPVVQQQDFFQST